MPLEVHYKNHVGFDTKANKFSDPKIKTEADQVGHLLMAIGVSEISDKTINEVVIRRMILDRLYNEKSNRSVEQWKDVFKAHLGLFIDGRWANTETRWKFVARHAKGMMRTISSKVDN
tara:strand:+ start:319 stop:672 length:354 start_codon:yes stop_codon:yes gene_type:complete